MENTIFFDLVSPEHLFFNDNYPKKCGCNLSVEQLIQDKDFNLFTSSSYGLSSQLGQFIHSEFPEGITKSDLPELEHVHKTIHKITINNFNYC